MRRFAQVFSGASGFPENMPGAVARHLGDEPDRYNIGKGKNASVIFADASEISVDAFVWGLVPRWSESADTPYTTVTARLDRAPRSRMYRDAWEKRRCVVPMTGYYKWNRTVRPHAPYFIQAGSGEVLLVAGLWECWQKQEPGIRSFTILTAANAAIPAPLVADGPIFLPPDRWQRWLCGSPWFPVSFLQNLRQPALEAYRVSRLIRDPGRDDFTLLEPVSATTTASADDGFDDADEDW